MSERRLKYFIALAGAGLTVAACSPDSSSKNASTGADRTPTLTPTQTLDATATFNAQVAEGVQGTLAARIPDTLTPTNTLEASATVATRTAEQATGLVTPTPEPKATELSLTDEELRAKLDEFFMLDEKADEGHSLNHLGNYVTKDTVAFVAKVKEAEQKYGPRAMQYVTDRAPLFGMLSEPVNPDVSVYLGLHNPNFSMASEKNSRLGFDLLNTTLTPMELSSDMSQDEKGNVTFTDPVTLARISEPGQGIAFLSVSADGKERVAIENLSGYEQMVAGLHYSIVQIEKRIDTEGTVSTEQLNAVAQTVVKDFLARHFENEKRTFSVSMTLPDGTTKVVGTYSYPLDSCVVQDNPDATGANDPANQRLMLINEPIKVQGKPEIYGTKEEGKAGDFSLWMVADMEKMQDEWKNSDKSLREIVEDHIQGYPIEASTLGTVQIPGSYEISPKNKDFEMQQIEAGFWLCRMEGQEFIATSIPGAWAVLTPESAVMFTPMPPQETPKPGETPVPTEVPPAFTPVPTNNPTGAPTIVYTPAENPTAGPTIEPTQAQDQPTMPPVMPTNDSENVFGN